VQVQVLAHKRTLPGSPSSNALRVKPACPRVSNGRITGELLPKSARPSQGKAFYSLYYYNS